jgi:Zn finger protein HypA/HybF involved in hydrogenase expression
MTQLQHITMNHLSFECKSCGHSPLIPVQEMIERHGAETTVDAVRAKARCSSCGQKTFEFRIVYRGGSYDALMGAANTKMNGTD